MASIQNWKVITYSANTLKQLLNQEKKKKKVARQGLGETIGHHSLANAIVLVFGMGRVISTHLTGPY